MFDKTLLGIGWRLPVRSVCQHATRAHAVSWFITPMGPHPKVSSRCPFHHDTSSRSLWGFLGASTYFFLYATACGLRRISTPSPYTVAPYTVAPYTVASVLPSGCVKTLGIRN